MTVASVHSNQIQKSLGSRAFSLQVVNNHTTCSGGSCIDPIKIEIVPLSSFIASDEYGTVYFLKYQNIGPGESPITTIAETRLSFLVDGLIKYNTLVTKYSDLSNNRASTLHLPKKNFA